MQANRYTNFRAALSISTRYHETRVRFASKSDRCHSSSRRQYGAVARIDRHVTVAGEFHHQLLKQSCRNASTIVAFELPSGRYDEHSRCVWLKFRCVRRVRGFGPKRLKSERRNVAALRDRDLDDIG